MAETVSLTYNLNCLHTPNKPMHPTSFSLSRSGLQALLNSLLARANQAPHSSSLPLYVREHFCGWLFPEAARALSSLEGVELDSTRAHFGRLTSSELELNLLLAQVATELRAAGCAPGWRNELLDIWVAEPDPLVLTEIKTRIAEIERGVVRSLGLITRAVHLNGWSLDGHLWVARRALSKATDPGMWDTLVGGLISSKENIELALVRESDEEAGLDPQDIAQRTPLRTIAQIRRQVPKGYQVEEVLTCECVLPAGVIPKNRDGEVMEIQLLHPETVFRMLQESAFTVEASIVITEDLLRRTSR